MMKRTQVIRIVTALLPLTMLSCGTSIYRPLALKDSSDALREETIIQLNAGDYDSASQSALALWEKEKTNANASLYALALSSKAGVGLFDLIVNTIEKSSASASTTSNSSTGNSVFNALESVLPQFTNEQLQLIKQSIEVLDAAPNKSASNLVFQRCLTAAIYSLPTIKNLQSNITTIQTTLTALPTKLGTSGGGATCSASTETINATASELSTTITSLGQISLDFTSAVAIMGECFPSSQGKDTLNTVSQQVSKMTTSADKGCAIPATQKLGNYTLPSCLNDTINNTGGSTAVAGDGKIAGCELFINCSAGGCF